MAHIPATTPIIHVDYAGASGPHTFQIRYAASVQLTDAVTIAQNFLALVAPIWTNEVSVTSVRWQELGAWNTTPVGFTPVTGSGGSAPGPINYPAFISFQGRGVNGARVRLQLFNTIYVPDANYRKQDAELTAPLLSIINSLKIRGGVDSFLSRNGDVTRWYDYANLGQNSYYQRRRRRTA
jgi:hypothetical protein